MRLVDKQALSLEERVARVEEILEEITDKLNHVNLKE